MAKNSVPFPLLILMLAAGGLIVYFIYSYWFEPVSTGTIKETANQNSSTTIGQGKPSTLSDNPLDPDNKPTRAQIDTLYPGDSVKAYQIWIKMYYNRFPVIGTFPKNRYYVNSSTEDRKYNYVAATFIGRLHGFPFPSKWWYAETNEGTELRENHFNDRISKQTSLQDIHESGNGNVVWEKGTEFYVTPSAALAGNDGNNHHLIIGFA